MEVKGFSIHIHHYSFLSINIHQYPSISINIHIILVGGFKHVFIFHNIWDNPSHWLIFLKMVIAPPTSISHQYPSIDTFSISINIQPVAQIFLRSRGNETETPPQPSGDFGALGCRRTTGTHQLAPGLQRRVGPWNMDNKNRGCIMVHIYI